MQLSLKTTIGQFLFCRTRASSNKKTDSFAFNTGLRPQNEPVRSYFN